MFGSKLKTAEGVMAAIKKLPKEEFSKLDDLIDAYEDEIEVAGKEAVAEEATAEEAGEQAEAEVLKEAGTPAEVVEESEDAEKEAQAEVKTETADETALPAETAEVVKTADEYEAEIITYKKQIADLEAEKQKVYADLDAAQRKQWKADDKERTKLEEAARIFNT